MDGWAVFVGALIKLMLVGILQITKIQEKINTKKSFLSESLAKAWTNASKQREIYEDDQFSAE